MKIFKHLRSDWFRYGFETIAVVVGILVAFALENLRDTQKVRKEEHEILVNLLNDLHDAKQQSTYSIGEELRSREYLMSALRLNSNGESPPLGFYTDSIFYNVFWSLEIDIPVITAYTDIKNTGNTGLITNDQIRQHFTNLELIINNVQSQLDDRLAVHQIRIDEIAVNDINFVRLLQKEIPGIQIGNETENNYRELLEDQKIRNLIALKLALTQSVLVYRQELDAEIDALIALIEKETNEPNE